MLQYALAKIGAIFGNRKHRSEELRRLNICCGNLKQKF